MNFNINILRKNGANCFKNRTLIRTPAPRYRTKAYSSTREIKQHREIIIKIVFLNLP